MASALPDSYADAVDATVSRLRALPAGQGLPRLPRGPKASGQVLWTSDRYGSRFAVAAPIMTADEPERWYLWDIDTCGHQALTVHSGYYLSSAAALAEWQAGVGELASAGAVLGPVDDPELLAAILPVEMGFMRIEAENAGQLAEYHRSMRLAEAVEQVLPRLNGRPEAGLTADTAATEFAARLRDQAPTNPTTWMSWSKSWLLLEPERHRHGLRHVLPAPRRSLHAAPAQLLPRRLRRPARVAAARLDAMACRSQLHPTGAGGPLPAVRARPAPSAARRRRHAGRLPRPRRRIALALLPDQAVIVTDEFKPVRAVNAGTEVGE